jgi:hypothetical protein
MRFGIVVVRRGCGQTRLFLLRVTQKARRGLRLSVAMTLELVLLATLVH